MCGSLSLLKARTVVLSCGARYRRPPLANLKRFEGNGVYYWASPVEAQLCKGEEVILVGGGNSAGQAAVYLASHAARVHMLIRRDSLASTMSSYLIERLQAHANITLHPHTEIVALEGDDEGLRQVRVRHAPNGSGGAGEDADADADVDAGAVEADYAVRRVFLFIGADPNTGWLDGCGVAVDRHGFIRTGFDVARTPCAANEVAGATSAQLQLSATLQTSVAGVFAIGDVRSGSTKRVAAAVGEGAAVVGQIHAFLANIGQH
jgi:thioredoxin reductase (NADPH)